MADAGVGLARASGWRHVGCLVRARASGVDGVGVTRPSGAASDGRGLRAFAVSGRLGRARPSSFTDTSAAASLVAAVGGGAQRPGRRGSRAPSGGNGFGRCWRRSRRRRAGTASGGAASSVALRSAVSRAAALGNSVRRRGLGRLRRLGTKIIKCIGLSLLNMVRTNSGQNLDQVMDFCKN